MRSIDSYQSLDENVLAQEIRNLAGNVELGPSEIDLTNIVLRGDEVVGMEVLLNEKEGIEFYHLANEGRIALRAIGETERNKVIALILHLLDQRSDKALKYMTERDNQGHKYSLDLYKLDRIAMLIFLKDSEN